MHQDGPGAHNPEALGSGLIPSRTRVRLRQRHSGYFTTDGWHDCVAETIDEYVALAVQQAQTRRGAPKTR